MASRFPRVSVLMIFLDAELFIEEAIQSVFAQTYDDWELLLIDDGSSDGSTAIARRYTAEYPGRVVYLEHPGHANRGMSASRNLGLRQTRGEYVALLDADDAYLPDKLSEQVALLDAMPEVAMLYGRTRYWFSWTGEPGADDLDHLTTPAPEYNTRYSPPELLRLYLNHHVYFPCTCSVLLRRDAVQAVGGFENRFRGTFEDMALWTKMFIHYSVYVSDRCWDWYRQHPGSSWAVALRTGQYVEHGPSPVRLALLRWIEEYLRSQGMMGTPLGRTVRRKLLTYRYPRLSGPLRVGTQALQRLGGWLRS